MLLIQLLRTQWSKRDRNIEAKRERASEPTTLSFQTSELPKFGECWVQDRGVRRVEWVDDVSAGLVEAVRVDETTVRVATSSGRWLSSSCSFLEAKPTILKLGETAQFFFQFRAQGWNDAWFEKQIGNVAWLPRFDSEVFRLRPFTHEFRYRSPLAH